MELQQDMEGGDAIARGGRFCDTVEAVKIDVSLLSFHMQVDPMEIVLLPRVQWHRLEKRVR